MKYLLLALTFTISSGVLAQQETKNIPTHQVIKMQNKKNKASAFQTMVGLACLTGAYFTAIKTRSEYSAFDQANGFLSFGDDLAGTAKSLGAMNQRERMQARNAIILEKCKLALPTVGWGSATLALTAIGLTSLMKGLGVAR